MNFEIDPQVRELVGRVRAFVDGEIVPQERALMADSFAAGLPALAALRAKVEAAGLWAPQAPTSLGGMGLSLREFAHVSEELGRTPFGHYVFNAQAPDVGNMELLAHAGSAEHKERWLGPLVRGEIRSCFAMTEPDLAGSNPTRLATRAVRDGDDYVIDGHKWFTSSYDGAAFAIVMAVTDAAAPKHQRASQIIVPTDAPGFDLVRHIPVMGEAGSDWASHSEVRFDGVRVPVSNRLGGEGEGFALAQTRLGPGRIHHCMRWIGICERALQLMIDRALTRALDDDGTCLADKQAVQFWLAESRAQIDAARLMVLHAAWAIDEHGAKAARQHVSVIKYFVADVLRFVLDRALQTHGALGMTDDVPIAWWYRHERASRIYDGADEVHKAVVARRMIAARRRQLSDPKERAR